MNPEEQNLPQRPSKRNPRIPIEAIFELQSQNLTKSEIAERLGCVPSNITERIKVVERTKQYVKNKAFMIRHLERRIYDNFTDTKLKKANLQQLSTSYGIIYDKGQLEEGGATQNIAYADVIKARQQTEIALEAIEDAIKQRQSDAVIDISPSLDSQGQADVNDVDNQRIED